MPAAAGSVGTADRFAAGCAPCRDPDFKWPRPRAIASALCCAGLSGTVETVITVPLESAPFRHCRHRGGAASQSAQPSQSSRTGVSSCLPGVRRRSGFQRRPDGLRDCSRRRGRRYRFVAVAPEWCCGGVATRLLLFALAGLAVKASRRSASRSPSTSAGRALYERLDFREVGRRPGYYRRDRGGRCPGHAPHLVNALCALPPEAGA